MKPFQVSISILLSTVVFMGAGCSKADTQTENPAPIPVAEQVVETPTTETTITPEPETTPTPVAPVAPKPTATAPKPTAPAPVVTAPVTHTISMIAKQWAFEPSKITVKQGDTVILDVISTDVDHGFLLPGYGINLELKPGQTKTVTFVATKKGTFTFSCNVFCGSGHGSMKGSLVVE